MRSRNSLRRSVGSIVRDRTTVHDNETKFHDLWAQSTPLDQIAVREAFEAPTAVENRAILALMGDLKGKRLLDVGAGLGESSVYFAILGADVTAVDISPGMVDCAVALGKVHDVKIHGVVQSGEGLDVPENYFDIVYIANTIHHVTDKERLFQQIHRALKPGGRFFSYDPLAYNPVINMYRRMATEVRTEDEAPLSFRDASVAGKYFRNVRHREFWILTLSLFLKYYLVDRVHPNSDRYWKRILHETPASLWWWMPLEWIDRLLTRVPLIQRLGWNMVMWGEK
jgi:SAM-dependent methyltransferase